MGRHADDLCDIDGLFHVALSEAGDRANLHRAAVRGSHVVVHRLKAAAFTLDPLQAIDELSGRGADELLKESFVFRPLDQRAFGHLPVYTAVRTKDLLNGDIRHAEIIRDLTGLVSPRVHIRRRVMQLIHITPFFKDLFSGSVFGRRAQCIAVRGANQASCNFFAQ